MPSIEKEPIYDVYCISRPQYQRFLNFFGGDVLVAQLVASASGVVLGGVTEVVGSNLARGKIFTASIGSIDSLYPSVYKFEGHLRICDKYAGLEVIKLEYSLRLKIKRNDWLPADT